MNHPSASRNLCRPADLRSYGEDVRRASGFTVLEMLIVISIVAVLTAIAVPTFRDLIASRQVAANVSAFASTLRLARSEAIKRGTEVTVCRGRLVSGSPVCVAGTDWSVGWFVFVDRGTLNSFDNGDVLVRAEEDPAPAGGITSNVTSQINFLRTGVALGAARNMLFRPKVPVTSPRYSTLSKRVCVNFTGGTRLIDGDGACS